MGEDKAAVVVGRIGIVHRRRGEVEEEEVVVAAAVAVVGQGGGGARVIAAIAVTARGVGAGVGGGEDVEESAGKWMGEGLDGYDTPWWLSLGRLEQLGSRKRRIHKGGRRVYDERSGMLDHRFGTETGSELGRALMQWWIGTGIIRRLYKRRRRRLGSYFL